MARKQSVILTPAEKKLAVGLAKDSSKAAKAKLAEVNKSFSTLASNHDKALKANDKARAALVAEFTKAAKAHEKARSAAEKDVTASMRALQDLSPAPAAPVAAEASPTA